MNFRQLVLVTHRWLGLGSSLVLFVLGITGAFLVRPGLPFNRVAGILHETFGFQKLGIGPVGRWIIVIATASAVLLEVGGIFLWWKRKVLRVRVGQGLRKGLIDLHHVAGTVGLPLMLLLAVSGLGMRFFNGKQYPEIRTVVKAVHTARTFPMPIQMVYVAGSAGFVVQGVTGIVMWWRPARREPGE